MLNEMNQDYKIRSLGFKRVGKQTMPPTTHTLFQCKPREVISHFNTLLPLVVTAKSSRNLVPRGTVVFGIYKFSLFVCNIRRLNGDSN